MRVWRGRAPAGAPATSLTRAGVARRRRRRSSRYGDRVEPNPAPEWPGNRDEPKAEETNGRGFAAPPAEDERAGRRRRNLLTFAVFFLGLCLVGGTVSFILYDRATRIDRGTPVVVVYHYIDAVFDLRDDQRAKLFECENTNGRDALKRLLADIEERERRFGIRMTVSGMDFAAVVEGTRAEVRANLIVEAPEANGETSRSSQPWTFTLQDDDGWRVCSAERVS